MSESESRIYAAAQAGQRCSHQGLCDQRDPRCLAYRPGSGELQAQSEAERAEIRDHVRQHGGLSAIDKYGRPSVYAAYIPEDDER